MAWQVMADGRFRKSVLILITMFDPPLKVLIVCLGALAISFRYQPIFEPFREYLPVAHGRGGPQGHCRKAWNRDNRRQLRDVKLPHR